MKPAAALGSLHDLVMDVRRDLVRQLEVRVVRVRVGQADVVISD